MEKSGLSTINSLEVYLCSAVMMLHIYGMQSQWNDNGLT